MEPQKLMFTVPGKPVGKGRPRFVRSTGRTYTDKNTASYENLVRMAFTEAYPDWVPAAGAVELHIWITFAVPASWSKKKQAAALNGEIRMTSKPDIDNIEKSICDGLNTVAWKDDSQIDTKFSCKKYGNQSEVRVTMIIRE